MNKATQNKVAIATINAEECRRPYSEICSKYVRNGQGIMGQQYFAELLASRASRA